MHIFGSLSASRSIAQPILMRRGRLNDQQTQDRVWNNDPRRHQVNRGNTPSVRRLREHRPGNQIIGAVTAKAARSEVDVDQTLAVI